MRNLAYMFYKNVGIIPLTSAVVNGAIGAAIGGGGRVTIDTLNFAYEAVSHFAEHFPTSLHFDFPQLYSYFASSIEGGFWRTAYSALEGGIVYSTGGLLFAKKVTDRFSSKKGR